MESRVWSTPRHQRICGRDQSPAGPLPCHKPVATTPRPEPKSRPSRPETIWPTEGVRDRQKQRWTQSERCWLSFIEEMTVLALYTQLIAKLSVRQMEVRTGWGHSNFTTFMFCIDVNHVWLNVQQCLTLCWWQLFMLRSYWGSGSFTTSALAFDAVQLDLKLILNTEKIHAYHIYTTDFVLRL